MMKAQRTSLPKLEVQNWKSKVDNLCRKTGVPLIIKKHDMYWFKKFDNGETAGNIVLEWRMRK
jgi:hypothetical protein